MPKYKVSRGSLSGTVIMVLRRYIVFEYLETSGKGSKFVLQIVMRSCGVA